MHYARWQRKGDPLAPSIRDPLPIKVERFVDRQDNGCWLWTGPTSVRGYGVVEHDGRSILVHRYMLERSGVHLGDRFACHRCDVRNCVNPEHLYAGTNADNMRDRSERDGYLGYPGESNPFVKLLDEQVSEMRHLYASGGFTQRELGRRFGVAQSHVGRLVRREARKD